MGTWETVSVCRLVGCVVAVGEMCCGEGHTARLSSAWRKEAEREQQRVGGPKMYRQQTETLV